MLNREPHGFCFTVVVLCYEGTHEARGEDCFVASVLRSDDNTE